MCDTVKKLEKAGIPSVTVIFEDMADLEASYEHQIGMPDMRDIITPRLTSPDKAKAYAPELVEKLVEALTRPLSDEEKKGGMISREEFLRTAVTGTWDECQEYFQGGPGWEAKFGERAPFAKLTIGLPVILPTEEKVKWMLTGTSHKPDELIGTVPVPADQKEFTVETVAINGVMAGCKPQYMPVLLAMAEMMATPAKTRVSARQGGGHRLLGVVSGPIAKELGMTTEYYEGAGYQANFSMRHAMQLLGHNAIGFWDQFGTGFFAEDIDHSPWTPLGVDAGFPPSENVFSLSVANSFTGPITPSLYRQDGVFLERIAPAIQQKQNMLTATVIIPPSVANDLAAKGISKEYIKQWLWEHMTETMGHYRSRTSFGISSTLQMREGPFKRAEIFDLPDDAIIHTLKGPEMIQIIVGGIPMEFTHVASGPMWLPHEMMTSIDKWR